MVRVREIATCRLSGRLVPGWKQSVLTTLEDVSGVLLEANVWKVLSAKEDC